MGLFSKLFGAGDEEPQCGHEEHPSEDSNYWYEDDLYTERTIDEHIAELLEYGERNNER